MRVLSPICTGNGAYVVHRLLESRLPDYQVCQYSPKWTFVPPALRLLCRRRADLIHTTPDYASFFSHGDSPLVVTFHNFVLDRYMSRHSSPLQRMHYRTDLRWFIRRALRQASAVTAVSQFTAELVRREMSYKGQIRVIYNGIDTSRFTPGPRPRRQGAVRVLFAGNLTRRKGADLLPAIAARLDPGVRIECATGLRTGVPVLESASIRNLGPVPYECMPELYRQVDILLFPTVREGFGLVAAEAMAAGLPVVASDCSSLPELVDEGGGGYLAPVGDVGGFAERINRLAQSPDLRREMGEYNRERLVARFSLERMVRDYAQLFEESVDYQAGRSPLKP